MPRPNPPRKRPRRPAGTRKAAQADAALTKQTAQSTQPKSAVSVPKPSSSGGASAAVTTAAPELDEMWSRRSYAILIALVALLQLPVTAIQWSFAPAVTNGIAKGPVYAALAVLNPISLLIASLFAAPVAKLLSGERRSLRFMETLFVAIVAYFVWLILAVAAGALLTAGSGSTGSGSGSQITPCPTSAANCSTPRPTPTPSAGPSASPQASASASPGAVNNATSLTTSTPAVYSTFSLIDILAFVATYFFYPPLYKRMRIRRPPPGPRGGAARGGASRGGSTKS